MDVEITKATYFSVDVEDRVGVLAQATEAVAAAGINLEALMGLPTGTGRAILAAIPDDPAKLRALAAQHGLTLKEGTVFLVRGDDRPGALVDITKKIAAAGINIQSTVALSVAGKFAAALTVAPGDVERVGKLLGV